MIAEPLLVTTIKMRNVANIAKLQGDLTIKRCNKEHNLFLIYEGIERDMQNSNIAIIAILIMAHFHIYT